MNRLQKFIENARRVHGYKFDYSKVEYVNAKTKVEIVCPKHGSIFQRPDRHLHSKHGCAHCAGNIRVSFDEFVRRSNEIHNSKYRYVETQLRSVYDVVQIECPVHGLFEQRVMRHLRGSGCRVCAGNVKRTTVDFINDARGAHGSRYIYDNVKYINNKTPVSIKCRIHGPFEQTPEVHLNGSGCPECSKIVIRRKRLLNKSEIQRKVRETNLKRYGVENVMMNDDISKRQQIRISSDEAQNRRVSTLRNNGSFRTSKPELEFQKLLIDVFGQDVEFQYKSDVYPFNVDAYILSLDLYIELNCHWSHGKRWYSDEDIDLVNNWLLKSEYYTNAAITYSVRDVLKRHVASVNDLNYVVFWNMDDFKDWLNSGCSIGKDWMFENSWRFMK